MEPSAHRFRLISVDGDPEDLPAQLPREGTLLRAIPGPDRPDYWLAAFDTPVSWNDGGTHRKIGYAILAARYVGTAIASPVERLVTGIAYVLDESLLNDSQLSFAKCRYVAIGEITVL